jgi:hypothetical protein
MQINIPGVAWALFGLFGCAACFIDATPINPNPGQGTVEIAWSINRTRDPNMCAQSVVDAIAVDIFDDIGRPVGTYRAACVSSATSITLYTGSYTANATLVDGVGTARTTSLAMESFTVFRDTRLQIPIDFPSTSFF